MSVRTSIRGVALAAFAAAALLASAPRAAADEHALGVITVRADTTFAIMQENGVPLLVALDESTRITTGSDKEKMSASDLIPGLRVKIEGEFNSQRRLVARHIVFSHEDSKIARAIVAGVLDTDRHVADNTAKIAEGAVTLQQHGVTLDSHGQALQKQGEDIVTNDEKMVATTGSITTRINNIDEFNVVDKLIVYFKNGRTEVAPEYAAQLQEFAAKAKGVDAFRIQVQGYASAVGARSLNEALSARRADAVTATLVQKGAVSPAYIFVPAAMGISEQFADNKTAKGQAENRRVIVSILQSKGLPHP